VYWCSISFTQLQLTIILLLTVKYVILLYYVCIMQLAGCAYIGQLPCIVRQLFGITCLQMSNYQKLEETGINIRLVVLDVLNNQVIAGLVVLNI